MKIPTRRFQPGLDIPRPLPCRGGASSNSKVFQFSNIPRSFRLDRNRMKDWNLAKSASAALMRFFLLLIIHSLLFRVRTRNNDLDFVSFIFFLKADIMPLDGSLLLLSDLRPYRVCGTND